MAWERLAHTELSSAGDDIDTGTFTAKQSLRVLVHIQDSGTCNVKMRFNGFADQSYSTKYGESGANDGTSTSATFVRCYEVGSGTDVQRQMTFEITNISDKEKHILGHTVESESTGASTIPKRVELAGKFDKTNQQITRIQLVNDASGSFGVGSYITVLGAKEPATADDITVSGFTAKKNLKVQLFAEGTGGTINCNMTFNNNTDQAYAIRESVNGGTDTTNINLTNTDNLTGTVTGSIYADVDITNISDKEKLFISEGMESVSGSGSAPERKEMVGKWVKTDQQITTIKANNGGTGSYKEGSQLIVWGSDGASDTTYPTLVGGYIFEESDTGKHFMYDGTNTWTEIS